MTLSTLKTAPIPEWRGSSVTTGTDISGMVLGEVVDGIARVFDPDTGLACTESCAPMWVEAGADLTTFEGQRAIHCLGDLQSAVTEMTDNPATYEALNPEDETGDYEGCLAFMQGLVDDVCAHPKATVRVATA